MSGDGDDGIFYRSQLKEISCRGRISSCPYNVAFEMIKSLTCVVWCVVWDVPKLTLESTRKTMMQVDRTIACLERLLVDCRCAFDLDARNCRY